MGRDPVKNAMNMIMNKRLLLSLAPGALLMGPLTAQPPSGTSARPNVIYILADDLGLGDLSCYGQKQFRTPNIDKLAARGIRFTQHYAGTTVSAPSRASLLTGLHSGHAPIRGNKKMEPEGQQPLPEGTFTMSEMFRKAGYATGAFGKWGLGGPGSVSTPDRCGFDEFYGYLCQTLAHNYYPPYLWHNGQKVMLPGNADGGYGQYSQDLIHQNALSFIRKHQKDPFFLFLPYIIPHAELLTPDDSIYARYKGRFPETPYQGVNSGPTFRSGPYESSATPRASFAAMVVRLDHYVGEIAALLQELGIENNTLVIFTSDNGPHQEGGADPDFFNSRAGLRGYKRDLYEGGIRVPMIACWPGRVLPGTTQHMSAFWDVLPTLAEIAGVSLPGPTDGISFLPTLLGRGQQKAHDFLYWEFHEKNGSMAVRQGKWKAVRLQIQRPQATVTELYDLEQDPAETRNVAVQNPEIVSRLEQLMKQSHRPNSLFPLLPGE